MKYPNRQYPQIPDEIAAQEYALTETIEEARAFRDDLLRQDEHSVTCAAGLTEQEVDREAVGA